MLKDGKHYFLKYKNTKDGIILVKYSKSDGFDDDEETSGGSFSYGDQIIWANNLEKEGLEIISLAKAIYYLIKEHIQI